MLDSSKMIEISKASIDDAHAIGQIQIQAWLCNYPNPALGITTDDIKAKTDEWNKIGDQRIIDKLNSPDSQTWVATTEGKVVGFIGIKKKDTESIIEGLFISPTYQGKGIGTKLMEKALAEIGNTDKISIEVLHYNKRAIDFYKKFGFIEQGEALENSPVLQSGKVIPSILMVK